MKFDVYNFNGTELIGQLELPDEFKKVEDVEHITTRQFKGIECPVHFDDDFFINEIQNNISEIIEQLKEVKNYNIHSFRRYTYLRNEDSLKRSGLSVRVRKSVN